METADVFAIFILVLTGWGFWATYTRIQWWQRLRPSPLLLSLVFEAVAMDLAALPLAFISARRLFWPEAEPLGLFGIILLGLSIIALLGTKIVLNYLLRALDNETD